MNVLFIQVDKHWKRRPQNSGVRGLWDYGFFPLHFLHFLPAGRLVLPWGRKVRKESGLAVTWGAWDEPGWLHSVQVSVRTRPPHIHTTHIPQYTRIPYTPHIHNTHDTIHTPWYTHSMHTQHTPHTQHIHTMHTIHVYTTYITHISHTTDTIHTQHKYTTYTIHTQHMHTMHTTHIYTTHTHCPHLYTTHLTHTQRRAHVLLFPCAFY